MTDKALGFPPRPTVRSDERYNLVFDAKSADAYMDALDAEIKLLSNRVDESFKRETEAVEMLAKVREEGTVTKQFWKHNHDKLQAESAKQAGEILRLTAENARFRVCLHGIVDERDSELDMMHCPYAADSLGSKLWHQGVYAMWERLKVIKKPAMDLLASHPTQAASVAEEAAESDVAYCPECGRGDGKPFCEHAWKKYHDSNASQAQPIWKHKDSCPCIEFAVEDEVCSRLCSDCTCNTVAQPDTEEK